MDAQFIGTVREDGGLAWPAFDINGQTYERPTTTAALDKQHFVVLPVGFGNWALLEKLRAEYAPKSRKVKDADV